MRRCVCGVGVQGLPQALAVDQGVVIAATPDVAHDLGQVVVHRRIGKEPRVELALHGLREIGPVAPHDFHADELHRVATVGHTGVALARAGGTVSYGRQEQSRVEFLELQFQSALDIPPFTHMARDRRVDLPHETFAASMRLARVGEAGKDEQTVGVAVQDIETPVFEPGLGPEQEMPALPGDGVRDGGVVETAGGRAQDTVERVHEDLDRLRGDIVIFAFGRLAGLGQAIKHPWQDRLATAKRGAGRRTDHVFAGADAGNEGERIDVEGTHDARIQALEVEHPDVPMQAGSRLQHMAAGL